MLSDRERPGPVPGSSSRRRGKSKEVRKLLEAIEQAGGEVVPCRNRDGHWKVYLDGEYIGGLASTPSDHRSTQNDIARLRRRGLNIDTKGRYAG
ncbi:HicA-like toxin [Mycobacterium phage Indlovu]|nr:HicA-like toxin [Mycobacterium phage Indlovu]